MKNSNKMIAAVSAMIIISGASAATDLATFKETSPQDYSLKTPSQEAKTYDTVDELLQSNGESTPDMDQKILMTNGEEKKKSVLIRQESDDDIANNAIVVPALNSDAITTVACPVGTTAQPDMTCLVTGNFKLNAQP